MEGYIYRKVQIRLNKNVASFAFNLYQSSLYLFHMENTIRNKVVLLSTLHPTNWVFNIYVCVYCFFSTTRLLCFENDYEKKKIRFESVWPDFQWYIKFTSGQREKEIEIFRKLKSFDHVIFCLQFIVFCKTHYFKLILNLKAFPPR